MPKKKEDKSCEIYIGNIPSDFTQGDVENLFKKYNVVTTRGFYREGIKTYCFLQLATDTDATNAVAEMCDKMVNGRYLKVHRNKDKRRSPKSNKLLTKDSDSHHSILPPEDFIPPLETPSNSQSSTFSDSSNPLPSKTQYSANGHSDSSQLNESRYVLQAKENNYHFQHQPKHKTTPVRPAWREEKTTGHPNDTQFSTDLNHPSNKLSDKFEYVHCSRKVISYNPRDLQNVEFNNKCEYSSEPVNVQVVNFPFGTTKNQIMKLFEDFSPMNAYIDNNEQGGDYTQATVTLPSMEAAEAAIMELDNTIYKRRAILVSIVDDDEFDESISNYDKEGYNDEVDSFCYAPDDECSEEGYYCRSTREQFCDRQLSRRFCNIHLS